MDIDPFVTAALAAATTGIWGVVKGSLTERLVRRTKAKGAGVDAASSESEEGSEDDPNQDQPRIDE